MKRKVLALLITAILTLALATVVYANDKSGQSVFRPKVSTATLNKINSYSPYRKRIFIVKNGASYEKMINLMRTNGFETGAKAMESKNYNAMRSFMNKLTDAQYKRMIDLMKNNGYSNMANMMSSIGRQRMIEIHNSMMGNY